MENYQQDQERLSIRITHNPIMANTKLPPNNLETSHSHTTSIQQQVPSIIRNNKEASIITKTSAGGFSFVKQYIQNKELPQTEKYILLSSWCNSAKDRYASTYQKWEQFFISRNVNYFQPAVEYIVVFLRDLFELGYALICSARSALNNIIIFPSYPDISEHTLIKRFVKGVFNLNPPTPCYTFNWDIKKGFKLHESIVCE